MKKKVTLGVIIASGKDEVPSAHNTFQPLPDYTVRYLKKKLPPLKDEDNDLFVTKDPPVNELPKCFGGKKYYATVLLDGFRQAYFTLIDDLTKQYSQSLSSAQVIAPLADLDDRSVCSDHASDISDKVQVVIPE